jgi:23S rRNA (guanosine2251-2'-O)-methyltransferase
MDISSYQIRRCENPECGLRYPLVENNPYGDRCPMCLGTTHLVLENITEDEPFSGEQSQISVPLEGLLDNIRSAWNVGSIFRTSDGIGLQRLHLCGITPTPEIESVVKTSLGAERFMPWTYSRDALQRVTSLKADGYQLWALEQDPRAVSIESISVLNERDPAVLIVGNEITGVNPELLDCCDRIIHLPMHGRKRSINVAVAFGIAVHYLSLKMAKS